MGMDVFDYVIVFLWNIVLNYFFIIANKWCINRGLMFLLFYFVNDQWAWNVFFDLFLEVLFSPRLQKYLVLYTVTNFYWRSLCLFDNIECLLLFGLQTLYKYLIVVLLTVIGWALHATPFVLSQPAIWLLSSHHLYDFLVRLDSSLSFACLIRAILVIIFVL